MDIIGAINKEREYLSFRAKGEEPYHLVDAVKEYGFESLKEYFEAKKEYQISQLKFEIVETIPENAIADAMAIMAEKRTVLLYAISNKTLVWNGNNGQLDTEYCDKCDIPIYPYLTGGGTIVNTVGDISLGICVPEDLMLDSNVFLGKFAKILQNYTNKDVVVDGNDILVDNGKVVGAASYNQNNMFMFIASLSLSDKSEIISCICQKHSTKQPGYMDFIDANTLLEEVRKWLQVQ